MTKLLRTNVHGFLQDTAVSLLARGPEAAHAFDSLVDSLDPERLAVPCSAPFVAVAGDGPIAEGTRVVSIRGSEGLVCGLVYEVVSIVSPAPAAQGFAAPVSPFGSGPRQGIGPRSKVTLRRSIDGVVLAGGTGEPTEFLASGLAPAGASLEATLLHLVVLLGWPWGSISKVLARQPRSAVTLDALGRTPLAVSSKALLGKGLFSLLLLFCSSDHFSYFSLGAISR